MPFKEISEATTLPWWKKGAWALMSGTMLLEDPKVLPAEGETKPPKDYIEFLTLAAHEYFHAWLVKRLKPSCFLPYDLSKEVYSHDLWIFQGFTSLYESIIPLRAGSIDGATY